MLPLAAAAAAPTAPPHDPPGSALQRVVLVRHAGECVCVCVCVVMQEKTPGGWVTSCC